MECGYALSSEEHLPLDLVRYARRAEEAGFPFALISEARRTAFEVWPNAGLKGRLSQELPLPSHFEEAAQMVDEDTIAEEIVCGPDAERHLGRIQEFVDAGFDHVYVHQVGPDQEGFLFYERDVLPAARELKASRAEAVHA